MGPTQEKFDGQFSPGTPCKSIGASRLNFQNKLSHWWCLLSRDFVASLWYCKILQENVVILKWLRSTPGKIERWVNDLFLIAFLDWLAMGFLLSESEVRVLSSLGLPTSLHLEDCRWPSLLANTLMPPPGQSVTRGTLRGGRNHADGICHMDQWDKRLMFCWTQACCSSWQLGNLPPSASHPLPPSASQPANPPSCLLCDSVRGSQSVHVTDPTYPWFAKTVPERYCR